MSTITGNEEMTGNAKCKKKFRFEPPFGGLRSNAQGSSMALWLYGKRIVDFLLAIVELFSLALTAVALLSAVSYTHLTLPTIYSV